MDAIEKAEYFRVLVDLTRCLKDSEWVMPFSVFPMEMAIFICWELVESPSGIVGIELSIMDTTKLIEIADDDDPFIRLVTICPSIAITSDNVLDVLSAFHTDIEEIDHHSKSDDRLRNYPMVSDRFELNGPTTDQPQRSLPFRYSPVR